jgi:serine/threonine protein kinase
MLPTDPTIGNGRYRLLSKALENGTTRIYKAEIVLTGQTVGILEQMESVDPLHAKTPHHPGLVLFSDEFIESGRRFLASEPLFSGLSASNAQSPRSRETAAGLFDDLKTILAAMAVAVDAHGSEHVHPIEPPALVLAANGKVKLLFSGKPANQDSFSADSPYLPLECIWDQIDIIAHKTIYNSYDPGSLAILESPFDERTSIYTVGAVFYKLLTGHEPPSALERSLEFISSGSESLPSPIHVNPDLTIDQSEQLLRMLSLRREERVEAEPIPDIVIAEIDEPSTSAHPIHVSFPADEDDDDLLEIPDTPLSPPRPVTPRVKDRPINAVIYDRVHAAAVADKSPGIEAFQLSSSPEPDRELSFVSAPKRGRNFKTMLAAAAVILAIAGIGIYALMSVTIADAVTTDAMQAVTPVVESPVIDIDAQMIQVEPTPSAEPEPIKALATENGSDVPAATHISTAGEAAQRKVPIADSKQRNELRPVKEAAAPRTEFKPKRKVTVDDLINDN